MRDALCAMLHGVMTTWTAAEIRQAREERGLSQDQLGALLGVTGNAVGNWERGTNVPIPHHQDELTRIFATKTPHPRATSSRLDALESEVRLLRDAVTVLQGLVARLVDE